MPLLSIWHYEGNPNAWQAVINTIYTLFPQKDMNTFYEFCDEREYSLVKRDKDDIIDLGIIFDVADEDDDDREYTPRSAFTWRLIH